MVVAVWQHDETVKSTTNIGICSKNIEASERVSRQASMMYVYATYIGASIDFCPIVQQEGRQGQMPMPHCGVQGSSTTLLKQNNNTFYYLKVAREK
jgi:hypothetical protein